MTFTATKGLVPSLGINKSDKCSRTAEVENVKKQNSSAFLENNCQSVHIERTHKRSHLPLR